MAEQWIKAVAIDAEALFAVVGGGDATLIERVSRHELAEEVSELVEEADLELEALLREIIGGELMEDNAYGYRRVLELVASVVGDPIESLEAVMPGRGWQELGEAWADWGLPVLGAVWGGGWRVNVESRWPWPVDSKPWRMWPIAVGVRRHVLPTIGSELAKFDGAVVIERGVPSQVARFGDPEYWPVDALATQLANVVSTMRAVVDRSIKAGRDLLLWHDGQQ